MALLRGRRLAVDGGAGLGEKKTYSRPCHGMFLLFFTPSMSSITISESSANWGPSRSWWVCSKYLQEMRPLPRACKVMSKENDKLEVASMGELEARRPWQGLFGAK